MRGRSATPETPRRMPSCARTRLPVRTRSPAWVPERSGTCRRKDAGDLDDPGLRDRHQRQSGRDDQRSRSTPTRTAFRIDIYRLGYYGGVGRASHRHDHANPICRRSSRDCLNDAVDRAVRLRQLDVVGLVGCARRRRVGHLSRQAGAGADTRRRQPHRVRRAQRRQPLRSAVPDVRHDVAGLQHLRRQQPLQRARRSGAPTRSATTGRSSAAAISGGGQASWLFNAEYPMVRWLEANGYDVSYTTGVDTDRRGAELTEHKVFLSVGHDEYWSGAQRAQRRGGARRRRPPRVLQRQRSLLEDALGKQHRRRPSSPYRTLVCYKETHANAKIDPQPGRGPGTWRDPRPFNPEGAEPENALTGTIFMVNGTRNDADHGPARLYGSIASGATRASRSSSRARPRSCRPGTLGLRVGRRPRQRLPAGRASCGCRRRPPTSGR